MSSDLTTAQNERLRLAMLAYRRDKCGDSTTELAKRLDRKQPSLSDFLNRKGGAAFGTAQRFADLVGKTVSDVIGPADVRKGENLKVPSALVVPTKADLTIGTFLQRLATIPGLRAEIEADPNRWHVSAVVAAMVGTYESDSAGIPHGGWRRVLDGIESGKDTARLGDARSVVADTKRQIGRRPKLPGGKSK